MPLSYLIHISNNKINLYQWNTWLQNEFELIYKKNIKKKHLRYAEHISYSLCAKYPLMINAYFQEYISARSYDFHTDTINIYIYIALIFINTWNDNHHIAHPTYIKITEYFFFCTRNET